MKRNYCFETNFEGTGVLECVEMLEDMIYEDADISLIYETNENDEVMVICKKYKDVSNKTMNEIFGEYEEVFEDDSKYVMLDETSYYCLTVFEVPIPVEYFEIQESDAWL